jgi:hypothetical protein
VSTAGEDTSWLEGPAEDDTSWLELDDKAVDDEGWLNIEDPNAFVIPSAFKHLVEACMRGTDRVMACDGSYLAYRPMNRAFDKETNPRTKERFAMFCEKGFYRHVGTYDEVQIYELLPGNPYLQKRNYVVGQDKWKDIRQAATAACERKWADYHDILGGMATACKSGHRDKLVAKQLWEDNEEFVKIRQGRGIPTTGGFLAQPPRDMFVNTQGLHKVGFDDRKK